MGAMVGAVIAIDSPTSDFEKGEDFRDIAVHEVYAVLHVRFAKGESIQDSWCCAWLTALFAGVVLSPYFYVFFVNFNRKVRISGIGLPMSSSWRFGRIER